MFFITRGGQAPRLISGEIKKSKKLENKMGELENLIKHFEKEFGVVVPFIPTDRNGNITRYGLIEELAKYYVKRELEKQKHKGYLNVLKKFLPKPKSDTEIFEEKFWKYSELQDNQLCAIYCRVFGKKENKQLELPNCS